MFQEALKEGRKIIIGLVHLKPMPGTPFYQEGDLEASVEKAIFDAKALENGGAHGCLIQTVDRVYPSGDDSDYARVASLALIANEVKKAVGPDFIIGAQIMWNCITPSIAVCKAVGAKFTRCTALIGSTESPYGKVEADPLKVMEYRKKLKMEDLDLIAEISGYHHHIGDGDDMGLLQLVGSASRIGANAVEIAHPDEEVNNKMAMAIRAAYPDVPIVLGGHTTVENVQSRLRYADAALVGACFEKPLDRRNVHEATVAAYMQKVKELE